MNISWIKSGNIQNSSVWIIYVMYRVCMNIHTYRTQWLASATVLYCMSVWALTVSHGHQKATQTVGSKIQWIRDRRPLCESRIGIHPPVGIVYFPWLRHQIQGNNDFQCLFLKTRHVRCMKLAKYQQSNRWSRTTQLTVYILRDLRYTPFFCMSKTEYLY